MTTTAHPGSEGYFKQLSALQSLPSSPETLKYLSQLASNPNSPFSQFLVAGKREQIMKDLAAKQGMQAQAQTGGGLPTIKQKQDQAAQLLMAQTAMAHKGAMPQPQMPVPAVTPGQVPPNQTAEAPDAEQPTMNAAHGGIMHAPVHDHMFNFAPGGIVAFAGKDDQQVQDTTPLADIAAGDLSSIPGLNIPGTQPPPTAAQIKAAQQQAMQQALQNQTNAYIAGAQIAANDNPQSDLAKQQQFANNGSNPTPYAPPQTPLSQSDLAALQGMQGSGSNPTTYAPPTASPQAPQAAAPVAPPQAAPSAAAPGLPRGQAAASGQISNFVNSLPADSGIRQLFGSSVGSPQMQQLSAQNPPGAAAAAAAPANPPDKSGISGIGVAVGNKPQGTPGQRPTMPIANYSGLMNPPKPGVPKPTSTGFTNVPTTDKPAKESDFIKEYHDSMNAYLDAAGELKKLANEKEKTPEEIAKGILLADQMFGVGKYQEWAQKQYEENKREHEARVKGRGFSDAMAQLVAYSRPMANWSQVLDTDVKNKAAHLAEDEAFSDKQQKFMDSVMQTAEARAMNNSTAYQKAMQDQKKAKQDLIQHITEAYKVPVEMAERIASTKMTNDTHLQAANVQAGATKYAADKREAAMVEVANLKRDAQVKDFAAKNAAALSRTQFGSLDKQRTALETMIGNLRLGNPDNPMIAKKETELNDIKRRQAEIVDQVTSGGIASVPPPPPAKTPSPADTNTGYDPSKVRLVKP